MILNLFNKNNALQNRAKPYIDRISFLMNYLNDLLLRDKSDVIKTLNESLLLGIPTDIPNPENRFWPDPSCQHLAISFSCDPVNNPNLVEQFILTGCEDVDNILVIGTGHDASGSTWSIANETRVRPVPPLSVIIQKAFWKIPGWEEIGFGEIRFLKK
uniref:Uncharacterized protein n=1 Tax=Candidatus Kentrum eta TaxID=2126337 RepID=A0A450U6F5_9GAMM|nr:MAG: hypothetical protein BECKH772A_GA0070896_1000223 [Candidatus Kentron sp. H]VFJ88728.1 MAG: hypothetical protein BECKH772B_GA0070898_1000219 [Candidatus Kentron sp. H]VFJ94999.1 MAG: hypothetical protein BECKH772C_GA0070978_1000170 [Candidatus Kentron sp. H]